MIKAVFLWLHFLLARLAVTTGNRGSVCFDDKYVRFIHCYSSDKYLHYRNVAIIDTSRRDTLS